jgi:hypothetical protein
VIIVGPQFCVVVELTGVVTSEDSSVDDFFVDARVPVCRTVVAGGSSDEDLRIICRCRIGPMDRSVTLVSGGWLSLSSGLTFSGVLLGDLPELSLYV